MHRSYALPLESTMRTARLVLAVLFAAVALSTTACTNPTAPKPAGDNVVTTTI